MLTASQKRDIVRRAIGSGFPLEQIPLPKLISDVESYITKGMMNPKDGLYKFVPQEFLNI